MLVLTRKPQQGFWIGDNVFVTILGVERDRVKIGISAPPYIKVDREELREGKTSGSSSAENPTDVQYWTGPMENQPLAYSGLGQGYCSGLSGMHSCQLDRIGLY